MTKFQTELRAAIREYGNDICNEYWHGCEITPRLESLIERAVDRADALCVLCLSNLENYPPGPGEPNINTYKKALELASGCNNVYYNSHPERYPKHDSDYWIKQAESADQACPQCHSTGGLHKMDCKDDSNPNQTITLR